MASKHCPEVPFIFVSGTIGETGLEKIKPGWSWKLARKASRGLGPGVRPRYIRRFLRRDTTFALLSRGTTTDAERLRAELADALTPRHVIRPGRHTTEIREADADRVLPLLLQGFLQSLDPSSAISVASERALGEIDVIKERLEQSAGASDDVLAELIRQLPPGARSEAMTLTQENPVS